MDFLIGFLIGGILGSIVTAIIVTAGLADQYTQGYLDALKDIRDGMK